MNRENAAGFTLVELVISMVVALIITAAVYSTYTLQQKNNTAQYQVTEMQQNLRAGLMMMSKEIKLAGYDPKLKTNDKTCNAEGKGLKRAPGVHTATATTFGFSMDIDQNGDCSGTGENVTYSLFTAVDGIQKLGRRSPPSAAIQAVAEYVERIEFFYTLDNNTTTTTPTASQLNDIRAVTLSVLVRAAQQSPNFVNSTVYTPVSGANWAINGKALGVAPGDGFRRRLITTTVNCRNMVI